MYINLKVGDVVLGGKFKNQRMEVKDFGTDELGQPTINGKKLLSFRIEKELPEDKMSSQTQEEMKKESSWLYKIAQEAFDDELNNLHKNQGMSNLTDNKRINKTPDVTTSGSNVGVTDEYNPTETESEYGQAV